jgi:RNA polymerase sigma-70 factor, ECF subfamily
MGATTKTKESPAANFPPDLFVVPGGGEETPGSAEGCAQPTRLEEERLSPLVERARAGDQSAFEELVRTMQGPVRGFARRMMRDPHMGDDAAQETFLRMWKGLGGLEPRGRFVAWSFTVARNTCIELLRRENRAPDPVETHDGGHGECLWVKGAADPAERQVLRKVVNDAIASLDEPYRSTILLRETGLAYDELSEVLGCPVGTVRSRLHEARRRLAGILRPVMEEAL